MFRVTEDVSRLVFCKDDYSSEAEFENEIKKGVMVLLNAGYTMTIRYDDGKEGGVVVVDYNYENLELGGRYPYWLSPEEFESVIWDDEREDFIPFK